MDLRKAKELSAKILKIGVTKVYLDPKQSKRIEEAMTKDDLRGLIAERIISKRRLNLQSKGRSRVMAAKRKKGRKRGVGKRKGTQKSRTEGKAGWMKRVRAQRAMLKELRKTNPKAVETANYGDVYRKIKGGFFKGKNYLKQYIEEAK